MISKIVRYMATVKRFNHITVSNAMPVVFVLTLTLVIGSAVSFPIHTCAYDEFYSKTLETCVSCDDICYEGSWGDCEKRCHDYYLTLKKCPYYQFWERNLEICINCSYICHPITNDCTSRCKRYIQHSNTTSKATTANPLTTTTTTNPKINNTQHQNLSLILVITIPCSIVIVFLAIVTYIMYITRKTRRGKDKKPIQVSDNERDGIIATNNGGHVDLNNASTGLFMTDQQESEV